MFIEQPNTILKKLYPSALWRMDPEDKAIYLTFDDGPIPEVTPWVLDKLDQLTNKLQVKLNLMILRFLTVILCGIWMMCARLNVSSLRI